MAVLERHGFLRHVPDFRSALAQLADRLAGGIDDDHAAGESGAAAGGDTVEAERAVSARPARTLSTGMPSSSAAIMLIEMREPADVGGAENERDRPVGRDVQRCRWFRRRD